MQSGFGCIGFCCFGILVNGIKSSSVNKLHAVTIRIDCALQKAHAFYDAPNFGDDGKRAAAANGDGKLCNAKARFADVEVVHAEHTE